MKFSKEKCKVLHPGKNNPGSQHGLESAWMGSSFVEKALEVLVDNKCRMGDQCAAGAEKASRRLGCMDQDIPSRDQEVIISLYSTLAWNIVFRVGLSYTKRYGLAGQSPKRGHKDKQRRGKPDMWGKAERTEHVQP